MSKLFNRIFRVFRLNPQLRFLSSTAQIEEATPALFSRAILWVLSLGVLACLAVFNVAQINEIAQAKGIVEPLGLERDIRHATGGIVAEVHANEGQFVSVGDPIVTLKDADLSSDLARARERVRALRSDLAIQAAYLQRSDAPLLNLPATDQRRARATNAARRRALQDQLSIVTAQIQQRQQEMDILTAQLARLTGQLENSRDNLERRRQLFEEGHLSRDRMSALEQTHNDLKSEHEIVATRIKRARLSAAEFTKRFAAVTSSDEALTRQTINTLTAELNENLELVAKLEKRRKALVVRATTNGRLKGMEVASIGGLVSPATTITKIVPSDERLVVSVRIDPTDIGRLTLGGPAQLRFDAFDAERYGLIYGEIERISAASFVGENGSLYYTASIAPLSTHFGSTETGHRIEAGMSVDAQIILGQRTVMAYLLSPVYRALSTAMTES